MTKTNVSAQIAADRGIAQFWGFIAALPVWVFALLLVGAAVYVGIENDQPEDAASSLIIGVVVLVFAYLFSIIARWTFSSVRAALTPQRVQAMWLRRFQAEGGGAFRPSRVIDRLARDGISALTLQDRDVQLSFEQRRNRLAPVFWVFFLPLAAALGFGAASAWRDTREAADSFRPTADNFGDALGQALGNAIASSLALVLIIVVAALAFMLATLAIMAIAALAGPIGAMFSRNRDDSRQLPRLLRSLTAGKRKGATVLRISDAQWREAVATSLKSVDVAIIDLSSVSDHIAWEIGEAAKACSAEGLVFICKDTGIKALPQDAVAHVRATLGRAPSGVVFYPASRARERRQSARFLRSLRDAICAAADKKHAP